MDKSIVLNILLAQVASDAAKGIGSQLVSRSISKIRPLIDDARRNGYSAKDLYIKRAITKIAKSNNKDIRFSVIKDEEKVAKFIVYFDFRLDGRREQVSFHSFDHSLEKFVKNSQRSSWIKLHRGGSEKDDSRWSIGKICLLQGLLEKREGIEPTFNAYWH